MCKVLPRCKYSHNVLNFEVQYIPRNMHTVFALLCFVVVIHWLIFPYPSGLLHWHCGNLTIAPVPAKQPWWIWINTSCEFIMNDYITTTKQSTTKPCAYFLGYTVPHDIVGSPKFFCKCRLINEIVSKLFKPKGICKICLKLGRALCLLMQTLITRTSSDIVLVP